METRQLKTFLVVAELLSFNQAAEALNLAQSTVSARIKGLEEELGVPLFDRLGKKVALTEAGRMMIRHAKKMTEFEAETLAEVTGWNEPTSSISMRIPQSLGTYLLPHVLKRFQKDYPRVNLDISSCTFSRLKQELRSGLTDVAFLLYDAVNLSDLKSEVLGFTNLVCLCSNSSDLKSKVYVSLKELENETLLLPKNDCRYATAFSRLITEQDITPATMLEINSIETIKACVEQDVGVALLPEFAVKEELAQGRFATFQLENGPIEVAILMILHKEKWLSQPMEMFIEHIKTCLAAPQKYGLI